MRVTQKMITKNQSTSINSNMENIGKLNKQVSSGKKYEKVSDNPMDVARIMGLQSDHTNHERYGNNIDTASGWLGASESAIQEMITSTHRIKELLTTASSQGDTAASIKNEFHQIIDQIATLGNSSYDGRYIFSGTMTDTPAFTVNNDANGQAISFSYNGDANHYSLEIAKNVDADFSATGVQILGDNGSGRTFSDTLNDIINALAADDRVALANLRKDIDTHTNNLLNLQGQIGARTNRMEFAKTNHETINLRMLELQSKLEDADVADALVQLQSYNMAYEANIQATSKLFGMKLIDRI